MARRYEIDELLWLRSSPLVAKPSGLPPIEEWMPQPDPTTQRKQQNSRDPNNPSETTSNRRPSFFEARHISRGSNSGISLALSCPLCIACEDIVLGPPKIAFASSRIGGKGSFDLTDRPGRTADSDEKNDRFNFRDKFFKERDGSERDVDRRDGKSGAPNGRRGEREDWNAGRPRRTFGPEDQERKPRRNGEFDRWETREGARDPNHERGIRDKEGRFTAKKDGQQGRSKFEASWFRDENNHEAADADDDKPPPRNREWRRDRHGADRDWTRGAKLEQEPEWLDSNDRDEPRRAHTQEDFERWKERMKAGSGAAPQGPTPQDKKETESNFPAQQPETRPTDGEIFSHSSAPFMSDNSMERFFGMLGDTKPTSQDISTPGPVDSDAKRDTPGPKAGKSSRFAGLFSPPPDSPAKGPEPQPAFKPFAESGPPNAGADQEGFQRILQMLGSGGGSSGGRSHNSTPNQIDPSQQPHSTSIMHTEQPRLATNVGSPAFSRQDYGSPAQENPLARFTAKEPHPREHRESGEPDLLRMMMQQARIGNPPAGNPAQHAHGGVPPPPGLMPEVLPRPPPGLSGQKTPNFLDDPAIANMQRPDGDQLRRRTANGPPPMGYFEDMPFPQGSQGPITPGGSRQSQPPMPLQRPPGLEHMPPPGWAGQPPPRHGNGPSPMGPPPGIPTPNRGINPNFPPGMMPMPGNAPSLNERQAFPRGPPPGYDAATGLHEWSSPGLPPYAP
ncbi:hypothetical protein N7512_008292 [Penicillium capsulatum]|nr:hypothetical protein N7512_008292 [Penicillium capsulatum]